MARKKTKPYKCCKCGALNSEFRLYRDYGMFLDEDSFHCNECLEDTYFKVPLVADATEEIVWGYTSCPPEDCQRFYDKPEKTYEKPNWVRYGESRQVLTHVVYCCCEGWSNRSDNWTDKPVVPFSIPFNLDFTVKG